MNTDVNEIFFIMPSGTAHGWGICGRYVASELARLVKLRYVTHPFKAKNIGNLEQYSILSQCFFPVDQLNGPLDAKGRACINAPVIQTITGVDFRPYLKEIQGSITIGYTFFEYNILSRDDLQWAKDYYDIIAVGSSWCEEVLRAYGFSRTKVVLQGIDPELFHCLGPKEKAQDYFVIFSGGKLEFRKGQDLVIRAVKVMQERYKDVILVNSWYNNWPNSLSTMRASPYISFEMPQGRYQDAVNHLLSINGLDVKRVITCPPLLNSSMPELYKNTDIGLFPNRCEGGTNLVLMEYMACGRPVIASYLTGHKDVLDKEYSLLIHKKCDIEIKKGQCTVAKWDEPDLDEVIARLDWAYHNREVIQKMGEKGAEAMQQFPWKETAKAFHKMTIKSGENYQE